MGQPEIELLLADCGDRTPQVFAQTYLGPDWDAVLSDDLHVFNMGPRHKWYWDTWEDVIEYVTYTDKRGQVWKLFVENGNVYAIHSV